MLAGARHITFDLDEHLANLPVPAPCVLVDGAAHRAGHPDRKLEAAEVGVGDDAGQPHHLQACARAHAGAFDLVVAIHDAHDQAIDAPVRD